MKGMMRIQGLLLGAVGCCLIMGCPPPPPGGGNDNTSNTNTSGNGNDNQAGNLNDNGAANLNGNDNSAGNDNTVPNDNGAGNDNQTGNTNDNIDANANGNAANANDNTLGCVEDADCDDGVDCTVDSCLENGVCNNAPDDALCTDDGLFCTGDETCSTLEGCVSSGSPCDETAPVCDEDTDDCVQCTLDEECDDGVECTDDVCDTGTGTCSNTANNTNCADDGLFCTGTESCDAVDGCIASGNPCSGNTPVCDEGTDTCAGCTDNGDCDDGVDCTTDTCNMDTGACTNTPDDASCDDGLFCTGTESCEAAGCESSGDPCSGATPFCDEGSSECDECAVDGDCDDDDACTDDTCDAGTCVHADIADCCTDNADCGAGESCDVLTNTCVTEETLPVGCEGEGFDRVTITLNPFPGSSPPNPLPTESFTVTDGDPFGVVVNVGDLGNNESVFMFVYLDENLINGNQGDPFGPILPTFIQSNQQYVVVGAASAGVTGTFYFEVTLFSAETSDADCENVDQVYNEQIAVTVTP